jgi:hypothetical protein
MTAAARHQSSHIHPRQHTHRLHLSEGFFNGLLEEFAMMLNQRSAVVLAVLALAVFCPRHAVAQACFNYDTSCCKCLRATLPHLFGLCYQHHQALLSDQALEPAVSGSLRPCILVS